MNARRIRSILMIFLLAAMPTLARAASHKAAPDLSVVRATLPNGMKVIVVKNPLAPVVNTMLNYHVGSNEAPKGFPGTAHALEHMMFRGSPGISEHQLSVISADLGGASNADTQQMVTQYFYTVPSKDLDVVLRIEASRMRAITGGSKGWKNERGAIEQEVAMDMSNPEYVLFSKLLKAMFKGTPYAHDALGTRPSFNKTTWKMLKHFHDTWYAPNNAVLIIVGDVDPTHTIAMVKKRFAAIPAKKLPAKPAVHLQPVKARTLHLTTDRPYGYAVMAFRMPGWNDRRDYAAAEILSDVLSSQRGRLYGLVPDGKALFTDFSFDALPESGLGYAVAGFPKGGDAKALLKSVRGVLKAVQHHVPADLVAAAKRREIASLEFGKNSIQGLAYQWSQAVVEGRRSPQDDIDAIRAVTVKDVERVARRYLDQDHAITAILTPKTSGKPVASKGFGGKESFNSAPAHGVKLPAWAEKAVNRLELPKSTVEPTVYRLSNGLKLIVQPEHISKTVSIYGQIRNRPVMEVPKGKEGVNEVLGQLLSYGSKHLDRLAFQKALDDISADESAGTSFGVQVPVAHLKRGVQLLADNELHPALPGRAFGIIKRQVASEVAGRLHSPDYLATRSLLAGVYPKHDPTLREATPKTVSALRLSDVKAYYRKVFRPDLTSIVVIGDVSPARAKRLISRYFGAWKAHGPKPPTLLPPVGKNKPSQTTVPDHSRVQDKVTTAETVAVHLSDPDYHVLVLGNHVFGGDSFATRLYQSLRVNSGLVYYVFTGFQVSQSRGLFMVEYACDPPNVSKAHAIIVRQLQTMRTSPVSADELRRAKALLLRRIPLKEASESRIAQGLLFRSTHDLPLDEPILAARQYMKTTPAEIQSVYAKYIRPHDLVQVVQGPTPK